MSFLSVQSQDIDKYAKKEFIKGTDTLRYRILYPQKYKPNKKYAVITVLHGSGERGNNNTAQLKHGGKLFAADSNRKKIKAIVIFPQCPQGQSWRKMVISKDSGSFTGRKFDMTFNASPTTPSLLVKLLLDSLQTKKQANPKKMYVGGLSMGGFGTFDMLERYPDYFAAAFPICGGGDVEMAKNYAQKVNLWIFHGDQDRAVDVKYSREIYEKLKGLNAKVKYTEYKGVGHDSWNNAFSEKELLDWILFKK